VYWDRKSRPEFGMCSVRFIQWFLTKIIKENTGDLKLRSEWTGFRFTQCPVSSGFTVLPKLTWKEWNAHISHVYKFEIKFKMTNRHFNATLFYRVFIITCSQYEIFTFPIDLNKVYRWYYIALPMHTWPNYYEYIYNSCSIL
jgi:hypothetical protein